MVGPTGTVVQAGESLPGGKVWATWAGLSCPLHSGRCDHTWQSTRCPLPGTQCQHSSGSCFSPGPAGVSQAPGGCQALWVLALGWHCQGCRASARVIRLSRWAPRGGLQLLCWYLLEGFCFAATTAGITQHGSGTLWVTNPSLPPLPASKGHFAGPQQRRFQGAQEVPLTSILSTPQGFLHGPDHVEAASCPSPACSSWSPKHYRCAQESRARSN